MDVIPDATYLPKGFSIFVSAFLHSLGDKNGNGHPPFSIESIERHLQIVPSSASHFGSEKTVKFSTFRVCDLDILVTAMRVN